jgi:pimeloyl-ACP methyl ester carboxylesterase
MTAHHELALNNTRLAVHDLGGPVGRLPAILLVHGLASSAAVWGRTAPLLAQHTRVFAYDQRGHGASEAPASGYDLATFAQDLGGLIERLGLQRPLLAGYGWGAAVVLQLAVTQPNLTSGLALLDGGVFDFSELLPYDEALARLGPPAQLGVPAQILRDQLRARWGADWSPEVEAMLLASYREDERGMVQLRLDAAAHRSCAAALLEQHPAQLYNQIRCPTLILAVAPPAYSEQAAQLMAFKRRAVQHAVVHIRHARSAWIHESSLDLPIHQADTVASRILTFAREIAPRA